MYVCKYDGCLPLSAARVSCCRIRIPAIMIHIDTYIWPIIKINIKIKNIYEAGYRSRIPSGVLSTATRALSWILAIAISRTIRGSPRRTILMTSFDKCSFVRKPAQNVSYLFQSGLSCSTRMRDTRANFRYRESSRSHNLRNVNATAV